MKQSIDTLFPVKTWKEKSAFNASIEFYVSKKNKRMMFGVTKEKGHEFTISLIFENYE